MPSKILPSGKELSYDEEVDPTPITGVAQWLEALRSGDRRQSSGSLRNPFGFCCLGVKRDLEGARWRFIPGGCGVRAEYVDMHESGKCATTNYIGSCGLSLNGDLPITVTITNSAGPQCYICLADINDAGICFEDIAVIIETFFKEKE